MAKSSEKLPADSSFIIFPNIPSGIEFGIDCMQYETGPSFKGICLVPSGLHFIYHSVGLSGRQGYFIHINNGDLIVRPWDSENIEISRDDKSLSNEAMDLLRLELERGDLNSNLGPYPTSQQGIWKNLSSFVTDSVLARSGCRLGCPIASSDEYANISIGTSNPRPSSAAAAAAAIATSLETTRTNDLALPHFADIFSLENQLNVGCSLLNAKSGASMEERAALITARNIDKSTLLLKLIHEYYQDSWRDLLGELQLAFLMFILVFSHQSLNHWKALIHIICNSDMILCRDFLFASAFIRVLYEQLHFAPADFFTTELSKDNFLCPALSALFSTLDQLHPPPPSNVDNNDMTIVNQNVEINGISNTSALDLVLEHKRRLLGFVQKKFGIFSDVDDVHSSHANHDNKYTLNDEDQPVVVPWNEIPEDAQGSLSYEVRAGPGSSSISGMGRGAITSSSDQTSDSLNMDVVDCDASILLDDRLVRERWANINALLGDDGRYIQQQQHHLLDQMVAPPPAVSREEAAETEVQLPLTPKQLCSAKYSWRYPLLFGEMQSSNGGEDMLMAAMRVLDGDYRTMPTSDTRATELRKEAEMFVEFENN